MKNRGVEIAGERLSGIGQGCMGVGGRFAADRSRDAEQVAALRLGIELGMTFIDTAEGYGAGHSEELVAEAVRGMRERVFLASKVSPDHLTARELRSACEESLRRLGTDRLDLYQVHWPNPAVPLEETLGELARLREQGKIRHIGVSNFSLQELKRTRSLLGSTPLFSLQSEYNLFERSPEAEIIPWCAEEGVLFIAYSPLDQGRVAGNREVRTRLCALAGETGCTPSQLALAFLRARGPVLPIPKALGERHIKENASAATLEIGPELRQRMDRECRVQLLQVPWREIRPARDGSGDHTVYQSVEEARANPAGHSPSPLELAAEIQKDDRIKPIRVVPVAEEEKAFRFDLAEGRLRFWAWVLAFDGEREVPVLVRD